MTGLDGAALATASVGGAEYPSGNSGCGAAAGGAFASTSAIGAQPGNPTAATSRKTPAFITILFLVVARVLRQEDAPPADSSARVRASGDSSRKVA